LSGHASNELRRIAQAQLSEILALHAKFRDSRSGGRRAVLIGYDLAGMLGPGTDLSHADFTGSSFYGSDLSGCRFDCSVLFGCDFRETSLCNASLIHADLRGCHFAGAVLIGANLFEADLREGVHVQRDRRGEFHLLRPQDKTTSATSAVFSGADLTNARLSGVVAIRTDFSDAIMRGCKLIRAHVQGANFSDCDLEGADFSQADTRDACFRGAVTTGANFNFANLAGADLAGVLSDQPGGRLLAELEEGLDDLLRLHLQFVGSNGATGRPLDLSGFDLRHAPSLAGACLTMVTARKAIFYGLDLGRVAIQAAKCDSADFRNCRLDAADMRGIQLAGARLNNASLREVDLRSLRIDAERQMHTDLNGAILRHADLTNTDLRGVSMISADLSFANLAGAKLNDADLTNARLVCCKVSRAQLDTTLASHGTGLG
jgi:uncharacterized protein YjbI with pentapeptide repeats